MPNEVLLSSVGGVLSLWLGVTIMTIVEITEAIYSIIVTCYNQCRKKTKHEKQIGMVAECVNVQ